METSSLLVRESNGSVIYAPAMERDYQPHPNPFGNKRLRWTIMYAALIVIIGTLPLWIYFVFADSRTYEHVICWIQIGFSLAWLVLCFLALVTFLRLQFEYVPPSNKKGLLTKLSQQRKFRHLVVVPCYSDPLEILLENLGHLEQQSVVESIILVVTFEATTPDLRSKMHQVEKFINRRAKSQFEAVLIVQHQINPGFEIAGACSNKNFGVRRGYDYIKEQFANELEQDLITDWRFTVTTCDIDCLFHHSYFESLQDAYNSENPTLFCQSSPCVYQPALFYNWNLAARPFFVRITGVIRQLMTLGGLIALNINPMSTFSYPLEMAVDTGFLNPRYSVDDIVAKVRWMCLTNSRCPVRLVKTPVISGPTSGTTFFDDLSEWARQIRRWNAGVGEAFHYFIIHYKGKPIVSGICWLIFFFMYYAILLCAAAPFTVLGAGIMILTHSNSSFLRFELLAHSFQIETWHVAVLAIIIQYIVTLVAFYIDYRSVSSFQPREGLQDEVPVWRTVIHMLLTPLTLLVYGLVVFVSVIRFAVVGKKLALHDMAMKDGFITPRT